MPREFGTMRGLFDESKNIFLRVDCGGLILRIKKKILGLAEHCRRRTEVAYQ